MVPATVADDPALPSAAIEVAGHTRDVHVREFGDPSDPVLFVLHGSASDMRAYQPLKRYQDRYHVVFWDLRGNGLSERVPSDELDFEDMVDEIEAMRQRYSPDRRITILGHSWSAAFVALYLGRYPDAVEQAVLIEPPGLKASFQEQVGLDLSLFSGGYLDMVWSNDSITPADHARMDYKTLMMLRSGVRQFFCDTDAPPRWPVWRPGGLALAHWEASILDGARLSYDFTGNLGRFEREVLIIGTECSSIGTDFQRETNATAFPNATLHHIEDSGHRLLTEQPEALMDALDAHFSPGGNQ